MRRSGARGHRADFQRNQRGGPRRRLANAPAARADLPPLQQHPVSNQRDLYPQGVWGVGGTVPRPGERRKEGKREKKDGEKRPEHLVHPSLCRLPAGDSQREWGMCARLCQDFMSYT